MQLHVWVTAFVKFVKLRVLMSHHSLKWFDTNLGQDSFIPYRWLYLIRACREPAHSTFSATKNSINFLIRFIWKTLYIDFSRTCSTPNLTFNAKVLLPSIHFCIHFVWTPASKQQLEKSEKYPQKPFLHLPQSALNYISMLSSFH